jgi:hypothetical protein
VTVLAPFILTTRVFSGVYGCPYLQLGEFAFLANGERLFSRELTVGVTTRR